MYIQREQHNPGLRDRAAENSGAGIAIQAQGVTKQYKNGVRALDHFCITVNTGEIFALLGQNGAGKSTLIRILTTYLKPDAGRITMLGKDIHRDAAAVRKEIACASQQTSIDTYLSLEENMMFQSRLYRIPKDEAIQRMEKLISHFGLQEYRKYPVSSYSGGIKRRFDIALNMMSNPRILFLDEPTVGMDVQSRMSMWDMMKKIRDDFGTTIFLTTHYLEEADVLSDTVCIMKDGREVIQGTPAVLRSYISQDTLQIHFRSKEEAQQILPVFRTLYEAENVFTRTDTVVVNTHESSADMEKAAQLLLEHSVPFRGIEIAQPTLEDAFLRLTGKDGKEERQ